MKRLLLSFVFLLTILFAFSGLEAHAQGREGGKGGELPPVLKGQEGTIDDLDNAYCQSSASPDIYVNPTNLPDPSDYDSVDWDLYYYDGGGNEVDRNDLLIPIGSAPNNGVRLDITQIAAEGLFDTFLVIEYSFRRGLGTFGGDFDYTVIRKDPEVFDLTIDNSGVCLGQDATLTLNGSESGYLYYLYRDGVLQNAVGRNGNGSPISFIQSSLPVGTYSYYVVAHVDDDDVDCETQMNGTPSLSVYPNPTASPDYRPSSGNAGDPVCQGLPFELFDSAPETSGYVYNWTGPGLSGTVTGHTITVSDLAVLGTPGDYDYILTIIDENNPTDCDASATVRVTINDEPVIDNISNNGPLCVDATLNLSVTVSGGTGPYTYSWSGPDGFSSTDQNPSITNVTTSNAGDYDVVITDANGCNSVTGTTTVVINENPIIDNISSSSPVCEDGTLNLSVAAIGGTGPYTYSWSGPDGFTSTDQNPTITNVTTLNSGTYDVVITDANGCGSTTGSVSVVINENPVIDNISNNGPVCAGSTLNLSVTVSGGTGPYTYSWSGPDGFSSTDQNPSITNVSTSNTGDYDVVITDANGCNSVTGTTTVVVSDPVIDNISNDGSVCEGANINLSVSASGGIAPYTYSWSGPDGFSSTDQNPSITNVAVTNAGNYDVTITDSNGCTVTGSTTVVINENPTIDNISSNSPVCEDGTLNLSVAAIGGTGPYTYSWSGPDGFTSTDQNPTITNVTTLNSGTYDVVITDANGCGSTTGSVSVVINENPVIDNISNNGPVCAGSTLNLSVTVSGGTGPYTYSWSGPDGFSSTDQNPSITNVSTANAGDYDVVITDANGCNSVTGTTTVVVSDPVIDNISNDGPVCEGANINLSVSASGGIAPYTYSWSGPDGFSSTDQNPSITNVAVTNAGNYDVTITDSNGCTVTGSTTVVINENPTIDNISSNSPVCEDGTLNLSVTAIGGTGPYTYSWSGPDGFTSTDQNPTITNVTTLNSGTYDVVITDANGCGSTTGSVSVVINENPVIDNISNNGPVCAGSTLNLSVTVSGGTGPYTYSWSGPDGFSSTDQNPSITNVSTANAGDYDVVITDANGCNSVTGTTTVVVNELPTVNLPNAATCDGEDVTLTATPSGGSGNYVNYTWYDGSDTVIPGSTTNQLTLTGTDVALANDDATYSVTVEDDNGCVSAANDMTLTVNENPSVEIIYNTNPETAIDVCLGSSMTLDAQGSGGTGTYNYTWELPDGSTQTGAQLVVNPMALTDDGVYTVTVDDGNTCEGTQTIDVTVVEVTATIAVTAPAAGATTICENTSVTFEAGGGDSYEFFLIDASAGTGLPISVQTGASNQWTTSTLEHGDQVYVTAENTLVGCSDNSDRITMSVNANPTVAITYPTGEDNEICVGEDLPVIADPAGYANYDFYVSDGTTDTKVSSDGNTSETFTYSASDLADGYEIFVVASSGAGCSGESAPETIVVHALPNATADNTGPECVNETVTLQGGDAGLDTYEWFAPGADLNTDAPIATTMDHDLTNIASSDAGVYTLRVTNVNGCQATATTDVVVNELPVVSLPANYSVCEGTQNHEINATVTDGTAPYEVVWTFDDGSGNPSIEILKETLTAEGTSTYTIGTVAPANEGTYTVTVTDDNKCESVQEVLVLSVDPAPSVTLASDHSSQNDEYCDDSPVTLTAAGSGGTVSGADPADYEYVWYYEGTVISGVSTPQYTFTGENGVTDGQYEVVAIDDNGSGCSSAPVSLTVTVHELPDATLDVDPAFFIEGTTVTFTAVAGYNNYIFEVNNTEVQNGSSNVYSTSTLVDGDEVTLTVIENHPSGLSCSNTFSVTMSVFDSVDKPVVNVTDAEYCEGAGGATVTVTNPQQDVTYELIYAPDGSAAGYGTITYDGTNTVSWSNVLDDNGGTSTPTSFEVKAYWSAIPADYQLSDAFDITEHPVPTEYTMSVDGTSAAGGITETDCNAGTGYSIGLFDGHDGVDYTLLLNGSQVLEVKSGSGVINPFTFDNNYSFIGTYTIVAENTHGCTTDIIGSFTIQGDAVTVFDLNAEDGGLYCESDADGVELTLSGSESGVDYELFSDGTSVGTFPGDGNALSLGNYTTEGQYAVQVTTAGGCIYPMNGVADVTMISSPEAGNLVATNGGEYCSGGTGVDITLEITQEDGVRYELFDVATGTLIDSFEPGVAGNGDITFVTDFTTEGTYQVRALAGAIACPALSNQIQVVMNPLPSVENVQQFDDLCFGGSGTIGIDNSESNVEYRWVDVNDNTNTGVWTLGNGSQLALSVTAAGEYLIEAQNPTTGCVVDMNGTVTVVEEPLPVDVAVTSTGGTACNDPEIIRIENPEQDIEYQLYVDDGVSLTAYHNGGPISSSDGSAIAFDPIIAASTDFVVIATNPNTQCELELTDIITVDISGAIQPQVLEPESGDICNGDPGIQFELRNSESGVEYALILAGETPAGDVEIQRLNGNSGNPVIFDPVLEEGEYYVMGYPADPTCEIEMANRVNLIVNPLPKAFNMIGPGTYCGGTGATLGIDNSEPGVIYRLQQHTALGKRIMEEVVGVAGEDTIQFADPITVDPSGNNTYSVVAISDKGCTSSMKDSIEVVNTGAPAVPTFAEDTVQFCSTDVMSISPETTELNATYYVMDENSITVVEAVAESGDIELGPLPEGKYTVCASWDAGACLTEASDTIWIEEALFPLVDGDLNYESRVCYGDSAFISYEIDPAIEWRYNLIDDLTTGNIAQSYDEGIIDGDSITWHVKQSGNYYIQITSGVCEPEYSSRMQIEVADEIQMPAFTESTYYYCHNEDRVKISLDGSTVPTSGTFVYRLIDADGNTYGAVFNDDSELVFEPEVTADSPDSYGLIARDINTGCDSIMDSGSFISVAQRPVPAVYDVTPVETMINPGDGGVAIGLENSQTNVTYRLYLEGTTDIIGSVPGTDGEAVQFDPVIIPGVYEVYAQYDSWGCEMTLMGTSTVLEEGITDYDVFVPRNYCEDQPNAVTVELSGSDSGVTYRLLRSIGGTEPSIVSGAEQTGNGLGISFFDFVEEQYYDWEIQYYVEAVKEGLPSVVMNDGEPVITSVWNRPSNQTFSVENRGGQCYENQPLALQLDYAEMGYSYRLEYYPESGLPSGQVEFLPVQEPKAYNGGSEYPSWDVTEAGIYQVVAYNPGCQALEPYEQKLVSEFEPVVAPDLILRIDGPNKEDTISLTDNAILDSRLMLNQFVYQIEHPVVDSFTYETGYMDVDTSLVISYDGMGDEAGRDLIYTNQMPGFRGKDYVRYSIAIEGCRILNAEDQLVYEKADTGIVTIIINDEKLPNDEEFLIPNAFSPNDDGVNDYLVISGVENVNRSTLTVFNRWGNLVYESKDTKYNNGWDGTSNVSNMVSIGQDLPNGVYFYIYTVYVDGEMKEYNGYIELRR